MQNCFSIIGYQDFIVENHCYSKVTHSSKTFLEIIGGWQPPSSPPSFATVCYPRVGGNTHGSLMVVALAWGLHWLSSSWSLFMDNFVYIQGKYEIDNDHAMVLAQMHNFKAGILLLYEKSKLLVTCTWLHFLSILHFHFCLMFFSFYFLRFPQILRYHMDHDEHFNVIETCKKYG